MGAETFCLFLVLDGSVNSPEGKMVCTERWKAEMDVRGYELEEGSKQGMVGSGGSDALAAMLGLAGGGFIWWSSWAAWFHQHSVPF